MTLLSTVSVAAFAVSLFVGVLVFRQDRRRTLNQIFMLSGACFGAWALGSFALAQPVSALDALRWMRIMMTCAAVSPALLLHLIALIFDEEDARKMLRPAYASGAFLAALTWTGALDAGVHVLPADTGDGRWYGTAGALSWLLPFSGFAIMLYGTRVLVEATRRSEGIRRAQGNYFLVGVIPVLAAGVHDYLGGYFSTYPGLDLSFAPLVPIAAAFWSALVGFTMLRYRLIDLDYALTRGMLRALILAVLVAPFFGLLVAAERAYHGAVFLDFSLLALAICTIAAFIVLPLSNVAERTIGKALFSRTRGYREALVDFSEEATRILDLDVLTERVLHTLCACLGVESAAVYVTREADRHDRWELSGQRGLVQGVLPTVIESDHALVRSLLKRSEPAVREELERDVSAGRGPADVVAAMSEMGVALALPLKTPDSLEGIITLGPRQSGDVFTEEDLGVLTILTNQLATAMGNARLYADLKRSREMIERSERLSSIGTMAAGLAHEIRNPLVSIRTFTQLLPERLADEEFRDQFLELTLSEVDRICALITELLAFARPAPAEHVQMDVEDCLERICMLLGSQARGNGVQLQLLPSESEVSITADEDQFKQVVMNVILNAIQACDGAGNVRVRAYPTECENSRFVCVEISDDGDGISEEMISRIFDPFFTTRRDGTGLGLSIAHQIVTRHGGHIDVRSCTGEGAAFMVNLPVQPPAGARQLVDYEAEDLRLSG